MPQVSKVAALAIAVAFCGGTASAQEHKSGATANFGSTMKSDGTMTMSPALMKLAGTSASMNSCSAMAASMSHSAISGPGSRCFKVRIENITTPNEFTASNGTKWSLPFSPGVFVVTSSPDPIYSLGRRDRGHGLRAQAEDGDPTSLAATVEKSYPGSGAFLIPVGGTKPKGILPGDSFEFYVVANPEQKLYVTTMNGQSNDWFYSTPSGIALFDSSRKPIGGDVTSKVQLYDAGTEADQELGIGSTQGPRQPHPRYGPDDANPIVRVATTDPRFVDVAKDMRVTVTPQ